ncbi:hypothetical protein HHUSO_G32351 [Huso huso]|uniref:Uncharacterized protein n=1 Tax=Huso huso TaxID=61971 RepID=A0ABR0YAE4_HUSHU
MQHCLPANVFKLQVLFSPYPSTQFLSQALFPQSQDKLVTLKHIPIIQASRVSSLQPTEELSQTKDSRHPWRETATSPPPTPRRTDKK